MSTRSLLPLVALLASASASAQLQNGSFESGGDQWEDPCQHAQYTPGGAPSGGAMHAVLPLFHQSSACDTATAGMLFQKLSGIQNGDMVTVTYWYKGIANLNFQQPNVQLSGLIGYVHGGGLVPQVIITGPASSSWGAGGHTIFYDLEPGDTAAIALGGFGANDTQGTIELDRVEVVVDQPSGVVAPKTPDAVVLYPDPALDRVTIRTAETLTHISLRTADGQLLHTYGPVSELDLSWLASVYLLEMRTATSCMVQRLVKE